MAILHTESLTKEFGKLRAVDDVSYELEAGELASIIGPNGAGKTTFFNLLSGEFAPTSGEIYLKGENVTGLSPHEMVRRGLGRVFQISNYFPELTVYENVRICVQARLQNERGGFDLFTKATTDDEIIDITHQILERTELTQLAEKEANEIAHGDKRRLELGMAIGRNPDVLLLDEPMGGLAKEEVSEIQDFILELNEEYTIVLVEHKVDVVKELSDRITVLHQGSVLADGTVEEIENNREVQHVYLREDV